MKKYTIVAILGLLVLGMAVGAQPVAADWSGGDQSGNGVVPVYRTDLAKNNECETLGYDFGFKVAGAPDGQFYLTDAYGELLGGAPADPGNSVTIYGSDGKTFSWSSTLGIDAVVVKAGEGANVYGYDAESTGDTNLHSPYSGTDADNPGVIRDVSHITFCYDYEVDVSKDAHTSFTRTYEWDITKSVTPDKWDLFTGDSGTSEYTVSVKKTGYTDSDWAVEGTITIENNTPFDAMIESVSDEVSGIGSVAVDCGVSFPYTLVPGGILECSYSADLPNGMDRLNTAAVTTDGIVGGGEATTDVIFGAPTTEVNKEISVSDTNGQSWGPVSDDASWTYDKTFTCDDEGTNGNTATIVETGQSASASVTVNCYALGVTKDAETSFNRYWTWTIDKSADQSELTLSIGQQFWVNYSVQVNATYEDKDFAVDGNIWVYNPSPIPATINGVSDMVSPDIAASVDCGVTFPYELGPEGTLLCKYSTNLPDASGRTNTVTAMLQNYDYDYLGNATAAGTTSFQGTADLAFGSTPADEIDECISVSDDKYGPFGTVCADAAPKTFDYGMWVGPYETCGTYEFTNVASFVTIDTGATGADPWTVTVNVPCGGGCTLTQGYWKTHSEYGPAPYDDTWAMLTDGADTPFFGTGKSYYEILWMEPRGGNAYLILAHQYIAAELNMLNGASMPSDVLNAWEEAGELLVKYEAKLSIPKKGEDRALAIQLYELLDDYNNGLIGPGHCSE